MRGGGKNKNQTNTKIQKNTQLSTNFDLGMAELPALGHLG